MMKKIVLLSLTGAAVAQQECDRMQVAEKCPTFLEKLSAAEPCTANATKFDADCCPTCKPEEIKDVCTEELRTACKTFLADEKTPECTAESKDVFDKEKCCSTCRPPIRDPSLGDCTKDDYKTAMMDLAECGPEVDFEPVFVPGQCAPSCKRPQATCDAIQVAKCIVQRTLECKAGETGTFETGKCCRSCGVPRPQCDPACEDGKVCAKGLSGPVCRPKKERHFLLKGKDEDMKTFLADATAEELREWVVEVVERFCSNPENEERCAAHKERITSSIDCKKGETKDGEGTEVEITADEESDTRRRLLAEEPDLIHDALIDDAANPSITATEEEEDHTDEDHTDEDHTDHDHDNSAPAVSAGLVSMAASFMVSMFLR